MLVRRKIVIAGSSHTCIHGVVKNIIHEKCRRSAQSLYNIIIYIYIYISVEQLYRVVSIDVVVYNYYTTYVLCPILYC